MHDELQERLKHFSIPQWLMLGGGCCVLVGLVGVVLNAFSDEEKAVAPIAPVGHFLPATAKVSVDSEAIAMERMRQFLYATSSGKKNLASFVKDRKEQLAWVKDPVLLSELEWQLADTMIQSGMISEADGLLTDLFTRVMVKPTEAWCQRLELVANAELATASKVKGVNWFGTAAKGYADLGLRDDMVRCLSARADGTILIGPIESSVEALTTLLSQAEKLGVSGLQLQAKTLIQLSHLLRTQGKYNESKSYAEKALGLWNSGVDTSGVALVCYGEALLNLGQEDKAQTQLLAGINALTGEKEELNFMLAGLRALAQLSIAKKDSTTALSYLSQAEGAARGRVPNNDAFWSCLYEQRAWAYLLENKADKALSDFEKALQNEAGVLLKVQALQGLGCAYRALGKQNEALKYLEQALEFRQEHMPHDVANLERVQHIYAETLTGLTELNETLSEAKDKPKAVTSPVKRSTKNKRLRRSH